MSTLAIFRPVSIAVRLSLAMLVFFASAGTGIGALTCSADRCGNECGMHDRPDEPKDPKSCCPEQAPEPGKGCQCEVTATPEMSPAVSAVWTAPIDTQIDLPPSTVSCPVVEILPALEPNPPPTENSPPSVVRHPDLGRAPPSA